MPVRVLDVQATRARCPAQLQRRELVASRGRRTGPVRRAVPIDELQSKRPGRRPSASRTADAHEESVARLEGPGDPARGAWRVHHGPIPPPDPSGLKSTSFSGVEFDDPPRSVGPPSHHRIEPGIADLQRQIRRRRIGDDRSGEEDGRRDTVVRWIFTCHTVRADLDPPRRYPKEARP